MEESGRADQISPVVQENLNYIKNFFGDGIGLTENKNTIFGNRVGIGLAYIDCITDIDMIRDHVLFPLLKMDDKLNKSPEDLVLLIQTQIISVTNTYTSTSMAAVTDSIINGCTVLFIEKAASVLIIQNRKVEKKAVASPENESTVLGSQESFTDDLQTNVSLLLKRLPISRLRFVEYTVGTLSKTNVKLVWLEGIAEPKTIEEAKRRIGQIDYDIIDGIGVLAELIEDRPLSLFPKYRQTERPDTAARSLTEGRFIILCNNSPFAFIAPTVFWDNFRSMDDYADRPLAGSYLRIVRYIAFSLSTLVSSLYLSFVTYNQAIVPSSLALSIAAGREGVPLPTVFEILLLTLAMTIIREAGLRMPQSVSYFVGTLAAIVIGQAIVTAGYVSSSVIIVIAIGTISSFAISTTTILYPVRLLNYFFILLAGIFGIFGVINGLVLVYWHLSTLSSFGIPYLYPVLPFDRDGFRDVFVRLSFSSLKKRMKRLSPSNRTRSGKQK